MKRTGIFRQHTGQLALHTGSRAVKKSHAGDGSKSIAGVTQLFFRRNLGTLCSGDVTQLQMVNDDPSGGNRTLHHPLRTLVCTTSTLRRRPLGLDLHAGFTNLLGSRLVRRNLVAITKGTGSVLGGADHVRRWAGVPAESDFLGATVQPRSLVWLGCRQPACPRNSAPLERRLVSERLRRPERHKVFPCNDLSIWQEDRFPVGAAMASSHHGKCL